MRQFEENRKKTFACDFDGVIRNKNTDLPIEGSLDGVRSILSEYDVIIFTARDNLEWVSNWLEDKGFPKMKIVNRKPVAIIYLDDHGVRFEGNWDHALRDISIYTRGWQD